MYVENHEFMLEVDADMPHVVFFTFNQPDEWDVHLIFINHILALH